MYLHTSVYASVNVYVNAYVFADVCVYVQVDEKVSAGVHAHVHVHVYGKVGAYAYAFAEVRAYEKRQVFVYACMRMSSRNICIYTSIYTSIYMYICIRLFNVCTYLYMFSAIPCTPTVAWLHGEPATGNLACLLG